MLDRFVVLTGSRRTDFLHINFHSGEMDKKLDRSHRVSNSPPLNVDAIGTECEIKVDKILKKRHVGTEYLVKWKGYSVEYNTWEVASDLRCPELVEEFEKKWRKDQEKENAEKVERSKKRLAEQAEIKDKSKDDNKENKSKKAKITTGRDIPKTDVTGFDRRLTADRIIGTTDSSDDVPHEVERHG